MKSGVRWMLSYKYDTVFAEGWSVVLWLRRDEESGIVVAEG